MRRLLSICRQSRRWWVFVWPCQNLKDHYKPERCIYIYAHDVNIYMTQLTLGFGDWKSSLSKSITSPCKKSKCYNAFELRTCPGTCLSRELNVGLCTLYMLNVSMYMNAYECVWMYVCTYVCASWLCEWILPDPINRIWQWGLVMRSGSSDLAVQIRQFRSGSSTSNSLYRSSASTYLLSNFNLLVEFNPQSARSSVRTIIKMRV